jgi:hypothetical protein
MQQKNQTTEEVDNRIEHKQDNTPQAARIEHEWLKTIILNLIVAASVCLARAALDSLFNSSYSDNYRRNQHEYANEGYPF